MSSASGLVVTNDGGIRTSAMTIYHQSVYLKQVDDHREQVVTLQCLAHLLLAWSGLSDVDILSDVRPGARRVSRPLDQPGKETSEFPTPSSVYATWAGPISRSGIQHPRHKHRSAWFHVFLTA